MAECSKINMNDTSGLGKPHKIFFTKIILTAVLLALVVGIFSRYFIGLQPLLNFIIGISILFFLIFAPVFYTCEEYIIKADKPVDEVYNELEGKNNPMMAIYRNFGAKIIKDNKKETVLELPRSEFLKFLGKTELRFKTTNEKHNTFKDVEIYKNDDKFGEGRIEFKEEGDATEVLSKLYTSRLSFITIASAHHFKEYLEEAVKAHGYRLERYNLKISLSKIGKSG